MTLGAFFCLAEAFGSDDLFAQKRPFLQELVDSNHYGRCGTEAAIQIARRREKAGSPLSILDAPQTQDSLISVSHKFKIHFDRTGKNAATDEYVTAVAAFADEAALLEIDTLGYPKPPYSFADSMWHIYLIEQGSGVYGLTAPIGQPFDYSPAGLPKYRSYIVMDRDFSEDVYTSKGLDAARVTVFHEFHHLIQAGDFGQGQLSRDVNFREMTSVWLEMRSTPWVTDYLQYLPNYLPNLNKIFDRADINFGYGQCIWMRFLASQFDDAIIRLIWKWYSDIKPDFLLAFDSVLSLRQSSFCNEYKNFGSILLQSGSRFRGKYLLPDLDKYPDNLLPITLLTNGVQSSQAVNPASLSLFQSSYNGKSYFFVLSRNTNLSEAPTATTEFNNGAFNWSSSFQDTYCDTTFSTENIKITIYPQPFVIDQSEQSVHILAWDRTKKPDLSTLDIFTNDNALVRHIEDAPSPYAGSWYHSWDGKDDAGSLVGSGIYYYFMRTDGILSRGKLVVVRSK